MRQRARAKRDFIEQRRAEGDPFFLPLPENDEFLAQLRGFGESIGKMSRKELRKLLYESMPHKVRYFRPKVSKKRRQFSISRSVGVTEREGTWTTLIS